MTNDSIDKLTAEYIQRLGKMSITELEDMRPVLVEELVKQGVGKKGRNILPGHVRLGNKEEKREGNC